MPAAVFYVDFNSANPTPPYSNWTTAAVTIQDAVDTAVAGDQILVTNGVYRTGGKIVANSRGTNRVTVDKALTVLSVNGPQFTIIQGYQVPVAIWGEAAVRCVYLTNGATLSGFTLTNGATQDATDVPWDSRELSGAGVFCESAAIVVSNCVVAGNSAYEFGGGAYGGTLKKCTLIDNSAWSGAGSYGSTLTDCDLIRNSLDSALGGNGGGAYGGTLNHCTLIGNSARFGYGGGAFDSTLNHCTIISNAAFHGGGAAESTLNRCALTGNSAGQGGGAAVSTLNKCVLIGNVASSNFLGSSASAGGAVASILENCLLLRNSATDGGGTLYSTLSNCTLTGNSALNQCGGALASTLNNCIVYFNTASRDPNYDTNSTVNFSCVAPLPLDGVGNITSEPEFVDYTNGDLRLQSNSPCINGGNNSYATTRTDFAGRPRVISGRVDIGAYEFQGPFNDWLQQYGFSTDGPADFTDPDTDGFNNWEESVAGTIPTDVSSVLRLLIPLDGDVGVTVSWQSVSNRSYFLERATDVGLAGAFSLLSSNIPGHVGVTSYIDTNKSAASQFFYRVGVQP